MLRLSVFSDPFRMKNYKLKLADLTNNPKTNVIDGRTGTTAASINFINKERDMRTFISLHHSVGTQIWIAELGYRPRSFIFFVGREPAGHRPFPDRAGHIRNSPLIYTAHTDWQCSSKAAHRCSLDHFSIIDEILNRLFGEVLSSKSDISPFLFGRKSIGKSCFLREPLAEHHRILP